MRSGPIHQWRARRPQRPEALWLLVAAEIHAAARRTTSSVKGTASPYSPTARCAATARREPLCLFKKKAVEKLISCTLKLIDNHIEQLQYIVPTAPRIIQSILEHVSTLAARRTPCIETYKTAHVRAFTASFSQEDNKKFQDDLYREGFWLTEATVFVLFHEVCSLHTDYIKFLLNSKVTYVFRPTVTIHADNS